jgi:hypothetical protein
VQHAILHDGEEAVAILEYRNVRKRIAVHEQEIGEIARHDLPKLVAKSHERASVAGRSDDRLHGRKAHQVDEVLEIARVATVRIPQEAVVAARAGRARLGP